LISFVELANSSATSVAHLRTLHIEECVAVLMQGGERAEPLQLQHLKKRSSEADDVKQ